MDLKKVFDFLIALKFNNNRVWFKGNQKDYKEAKTKFEHFIDLLIAGISGVDSNIGVLSAKDCMFRIHRDVRFSKNKEPYKVNFGASIAKGGRKSHFAGYYIHFEPDNSFIGGGIYQPDSKTLKLIRTSIFNNVDKYKSVINDKHFKEFFPEIYGDKLKTAPRGFPKDFPDIDLLNNKHYAVIHPVDNSFWFRDDLIENILDIIKAQYKFNQFLNRAVIA